MTYSVSDFIGNVGVAIVLVTYLGLQLGKIDGLSPVYSTANAIGAVLILVSLYFNFNLSAFIIEIFWVVISLIGLYRALRVRRTGNTGEHTNST